MSWYPGHMKKAIDEIRDKLQLVDVIIEVVDARMPNASKNPLIDNLAKNKKHIILLNKSDLADPIETDRWISEYNKEYKKAIAINAKNPNDIKKVFRLLENIRRDIMNKKSERVENFELKAIVVGMPNTGKSTFLNAIKGKKSAKVGNMPGVTRTQQWMRVNDNILLLDTPGILMTNREDEEKLLLLKILNSMDSDMDDSDLAFKAIEILVKYYPDSLSSRFNIEIEGTLLEIFENIARKRGAIISRGEIDYTRAGAIVLNELRNGKLGNITMEKI